MFRSPATLFHENDTGYPAFLPLKSKLPHKLPHHDTIFAKVLAELTRGNIPPSVAAAAEMLKPMTIGLRLRAPIVMNGARLFRVRRMEGKPLHRAELGAPPAGVASIGRLNDQGVSVLYLADSPATAFLEAKLGPGTYALSEWRVAREKVVLVNGGMDHKFLANAFPNDLDAHRPVTEGREDLQVAALFRRIFSLAADENPLLYRWSIACGLANGFAPLCERTDHRTVDGNTHFSGRYPFSGIAYASTRSDRDAVNFAFNDLGQTYVRLHHVQWVDRAENGTFASLDCAAEVDRGGHVNWLGRPSRYVLPPGASARLKMVAPDVWTYEQLDGDLPEFV